MCQRNNAHIFSYNCVVTIEQCNSARCSRISFQFRLRSLFSLSPSHSRSTQNSKTFKDATNKENNAFTRRFSIFISFFLQFVFVLVNQRTVTRCGTSAWQQRNRVSRFDSRRRPKIVAFLKDVIFQDSVSVQCGTKQPTMDRHVLRNAYLAKHNIQINIKSPFYI